MASVDMHFRSAQDSCQCQECPLTIDFIFKASYMSEAQNEPVEPFKLHDPTKAGPAPTVNDKPFAAADVQLIGTVDLHLTGELVASPPELRCR